MDKKKWISIRISFLIVILFSGLLTDSLNAQINTSETDSTQKSAIRLFIDCPGGCDMDYIREEIPYINYVRDVHEAQLYLLITRHSTGSGGRSYSLFYSGQLEFSGMKDTLYYFSSPDDTQDIIRERLTNTIALGLIRYVARTPIRSRVLVSYIGERQDRPEQVADEWNYWVFQIEFAPKFKLEQRNKEFAWDLEIDADRITADWKIENEFEYDQELEIFIREKYDSETGETVKTRTEAVTKSWKIDNKTVRSLSDHWSAGMRSEVRSSSYRNLDLRVSWTPAIEYNIFPYSQYNQRSFYIQYGLGYVYNNYVDTTVYNKTNEKLFEQSLDIRLRVQQSWGFSEIRLRASNYLHDFQKNYLEFRGDLNFRLFRGFSLSVTGRMALIHNQIELPKGDRSAEEIYLRLRELETNYRYELGIGLKYTFGSIYNNIVNPRF